jgi:hypothetical protein
MYDVAAERHVRRALDHAAIPIAAGDSLERSVSWPASPISVCRGLYARTFHGGIGLRTPHLYNYRRPENRFPPAIPLASPVCLRPIGHWQ